MTAEFESYVRLETLREKFRAEVRALLEICRRAGDTRAEAMDWIASDAEIGMLYEQIENLGGFNY